MRRLRPEVGRAGAGELSDVSLGDDRDGQRGLLHGGEGELMTCDYCTVAEAVFLITRVMQPSFVRPACQSCANKQHHIHGVLVVMKLYDSAR